MFKLGNIVMLSVVVLSVVVAGGMSTSFSFDRNHRPIARIDPSREPREFAGLAQEPIVTAEPPDDVRKAERSRRAIRPAGDPKREYRLTYEGVMKGWEGGTLRPRPAEPMPPTYCRSIERAPKDTNRTTGPYDAHNSTVDLFVESSGFGARRMFSWKNDRGSK